MDFKNNGVKQLTKEQAIEFAQTKAWEFMDDREKVGFQLFQEHLCMPFDVLHEAITKVLGRPVYTHEFGLDYDGLVSEFLGDRCAPTIDDIMNLIPEEKRIIIGI
jgi:hypothetical protein